MHYEMGDVMKSGSVVVYGAGIKTKILNEQKG